MKTCNSCESGTNPTSVPYVVYESSMARNERTIKKLIIALIVTILLIFASNGIWLYAWMQYDYSGTYEEVIVEQDAQDGGDTNYIGNDGEIYNGVSKNNNP